MSWLSKAFRDPVSAITLGAIDKGDVSSAWDSYTGKTQQKDANEANISSAREQMAFQERMSNTAHVREVSDLKAAGLNPMLSSKLGGASSPAGQSATVAPLPSGSQKFLSTAMDVSSFSREQRVANQGVRESQSREDLNRAQAVDTAMSADLKRGGTPARVLGTDLPNFIRKLLQRGFNSAKESYRKFDMSPKPKRKRERGSYPAPSSSNTRSERNTFYSK